MEPHLVTGICVLFTALTGMAAYVKWQHEKTEKRLEKCEEDREELWDMFVQTATASLDRDRPKMEHVKDIATARVIGKRIKPPSDPPAEVDETVKQV